MGVKEPLGAMDDLFDKCDSITVTISESRCGQQTYDLAKLFIRLVLG